MGNAHRLALDNVDTLRSNALSSLHEPLTCDRSIERSLVHLAHAIVPTAAYLALRCFHPLVLHLLTFAYNV